MPPQYFAPRRYARAGAHADVQGVRVRARENAINRGTCAMPPAARQAVEKVQR